MWWDTSITAPLKMRTPLLTTTVHNGMQFRPLHKGHLTNYCVSLVSWLEGLTVLQSITDGPIAPIKFLARVGSEGTNQE